MAKTPRFKRITTALDDDARARLCQSSGSEHSANSLTDLSDLVDSFFDGDDDDDRCKTCVENDDPEETEYDQKAKAEGYYGTDTDINEMLIDLIGGRTDDEDEYRVKRVIGQEVETVCRNSVENCSSEGFKRHLMTLLRQLGFDAGLCKSRWDKTGRYPSGEYEYIDVLISNTRYIIEPSFRSEFTIARPTKAYQTLLETLPNITIIKPNDLKKLVRLMCAAMRDSLKARNMIISPWRKNGYMQAKWLGMYKRTTNRLPLKLTEGRGYGDGGFNGERLLGFEYLPVVGGGKSYCKMEVGKMRTVSNLKGLMLSGRCVNGSM